MAAIALSSLPLGFRFHPTDEELVNHYLKPKITGRSNSEVQVIAEIDVCKCEPWDLPDKSLIRSEDPEWFYFAPKDRKYPNGQRSNRATEKGYWKATGKDRTIKSKPSPAKSTIIGMKKTLVFHRGRAPKGVRTNWIMHEYRTTEPEFESGDQGGYVLYRLFRKAEENSSSSNSDEMEMNVFSPTPTKSSPSGTQNEAEVMDEIEPVLNIDSPTSDLQEEPKSSSDVVKKKPSDLKKWSPGEDYTTNQPVKQEKSSCNLVSPDEEAKVDEKADSWQDVLAQFFELESDQTDCDVFPNLSSPMLPYVDYPFGGNINQQEQTGSYLVNSAGDDALNAYLISALNPDDCFSSASIVPKESFVETFPKYGSWDSASFKDSGSGSDIDAEPGLPQSTAGLEASQCFYGLSLLPSGSLQMNNSVAYPEMKTQLSTLYENASLLPYDNTGPDVYSVDYGAESLQDLFNSMDELGNQKTVCDSGHDFPGTGIKLRSRHRQQDQTNPNYLLQQGGAARRIQLQSSIKVPFGIGLHDSTNRDDNADKGSREQVEHELLDSVEESTSEKNPMSNRDGLLDTGIKIRARQLQNLPDEPFALHATALFTQHYDLQSESVSDEESSIIDDNADQESMVKVKHELFDGLEESMGEKNAMSNRDDLLDTGIKIRARQSQNSPNEPFTQHSTTLFTQHYDLQCESFYDDESSIRDVNADKESAAKVKHELCDRLEESTDEKNAMSNRDDLYVTGIKIRSWQLQNSPNEPSTQRATNSTNFSHQHCDLQCGSVSDSESSIRDNHDSKAGRTKAGDHVNDNISESAASALPAVLDKLEGLSVHDEMPTSTAKYEASKSKLRLRLRTKLTGDGDDIIKSSPLHLKAPRSHSVVACTIYWVSSSILVLLCLGAWRCMSSPGVKPL